MAELLAVLIQKHYLGGGQPTISKKRKIPMNTPLKSRKAYFHTHMKLTRVNVLITVVILSTLALTANRVLSAHRVPLDRAYTEHTHTQAVSLPMKCAPFYHDSTSRWAACMGVEPK